ncbi:Ribosomal protein L11 methyltransferase [Leptospirillum ferriphilum]|uniref:Ribosomal protein L11 methyltransferase n=1 Tax=Leptospirillum ferriphilum TaxID=178606 RepID=A0A094WAI6_9BACT|nr:50S ribosomal protein L11 methyltransferase [Leptospirillum ferriphilum]KGA92667.1 Ribosomal protein L11 methyltransferase [Leptospirillum ferriphilum]
MNACHPTILFRLMTDPREANFLSGWLEKSTGQTVVEEIFDGRSVLSVSVGHMDGLKRALLAEAGRSLGGTVLPEEVIAETDWDSFWKKQGFSRFTVNRWMHVVPEWEDIPVVQEPVLRLHPHLAFGTGLHETTGQCLSLLVEHRPVGKNPKSAILDFGSGTGILGIAALKLGYGKMLYAVDDDPLAVDSTVNNLRLNGLDGASVVGSDFCEIAREFLKKRNRFGVVLANVTGNVIVRFLPEWHGLLEPGGILILSGISTRELGRIESFCPPPFSVYRRKRFHTIFLRKASC